MLSLRSERLEGSWGKPLRCLCRCFIGVYSIFLLFFIGFYWGLLVFIEVLLVFIFCSYFLLFFWGLLVFIGVLLGFYWCSIGEKTCEWQFSLERTSLVKV